MEYLGDAILGAIIADYLYHQQPGIQEGKLTSTRSKLVSREALNKLALSIQLEQHVICGANLLEGTSILGNAMEALFGAIYLDLGYEKAKTISLKIIQQHQKIETIIEGEDHNFKSRLLEWGQKNKKEVKFVLIESPNDNIQTFQSQVMIDNKSFGVGEGVNKKKSEQMAAKKALSRLNRS